jgi:nicotinamide-nucleotide amidase
MVKKDKRVGLVATGDELVNGDILNTNGQYFTQRFIDLGISPGQQVVVSDDTDEISDAIRYLLKDHEAVITIGGLGPTSDDKTRYGLAKALHVELEFYENAWQWIEDRLSDLGLKIPETNRQQALLPKGSKAIHNANGTAAACYFNYEGQHLFMLPGPPNECRPIFDDFVINKLIEKHYTEKTYRKTWLLYAVSEGAIANQLEPMMKDFPECHLGFRVCSPYLEIKLHSENQNKLLALSDQFMKIFGEKIVSTQRKTASEQLKELMVSAKLHFQIVDNATGGALQHCLTNPETYPYLTEKDGYRLEVKGLNAYWKSLKDKTHIPLDMNIQHNDLEQNLALSIPYRGERTINFAVERICLEFLKWYRAP